MPDPAPDNPIQPPEVTDADMLRPGPSERGLMVIGAVFGLFMMAVLGFLVLRSTPVPCANRPIFVAFFALGCACASTLLGGYAAYRGKVGKAGAVSIGGGVLVLIAVLILGNKLWSGNCTDPLPPLSVVWGSISGLTDADTVWPDQVDDFDTYQRTNPIPQNRTYRFEWIIRFTAKRLPVRFELQHKIQKPKLDAQLQFLGSAPAETEGDPVREQKFFLPDGPPPIILEYQAPQGSDTQGVLSWRTSTGSAPLQWVKAENHESLPGRSGGHALARAFSLLSLEAYAAEASPCSAPSGSPQRQMLLEQLASPDLARQIAGRNILIKGAGACLGFITDALRDPSAVKSRQRGVLIANLAAATDGIAAQKVPIPGQLYADLATAEYGLGQFDRAARYFALVDPATKQKDPTLLYYQGYTQSKLGKPQEAINSYRQYQTVAEPDAQTSGVVHTSIGMALYELGKSKDQRGDVKGAQDLYEQSTQELQKAVQTNPKIPAAKAQLDVSRKASATTRAKLSGAK